MIRRATTFALAGVALGAFLVLGAALTVLDALDPVEPESP